MNKKEAILILSIVTLIVVLLVSALVAVNKPKQGIGFAPSPTATPTDASTTVGTTTKLILSANTAALFRDICNPSPSTGTLYLWLNSTSSGFVSASGIAVATNTCIQLSEQQGNMWLGNIYGIMSNVSTTITYHEQ